MTFEFAVSLFFKMLPSQIPVLVVSLIGLYHALTRKELAPRAFKAAAWGFSLLMVNSLVGTALQVAMLGIQTTMRNQGVAESYFWPNILGVVSGLSFIAGIVLVARAVFLDRKSNQ